MIKSTTKAFCLPQLKDEKTENLKFYTNVSVYKTLLYQQFLTKSFSLRTVFHLNAFIT